MISEFKLIIGKIEAWLTALLALELRTAGTPFKTGGACLAQIEQRLIRSVLGDIPRPGKVLPPDFVTLFLEFSGGGFFACLIVPIPLRQRPGPHKAGHSGGFGKVGCLLRRGMQPDLVRLDHQRYPFRVQPLESSSCAIASRGAVPRRRSQWRSNPAPALLRGRRFRHS